MGRPKKEAVIKSEETAAVLHEVAESAFTVSGSLQQLREQIQAANLTLQLTHLQKKIAKAAKPDIDQAIVNVIAKVGRVAKNGFNDFHKYHYVTAADIIEEVRTAVAEEGITIIPLGIRDEVRTPTNGRNGDIITGVIDYKLTGPDGSFKIVPLKAQGQDAGDKAYYKLTTGAMKYLYIQVFLIPQGDDPEDEKGRKPDNDNGQSWKNNQGNQNNAPAATNQQQAAEPAKPAEKPYLGKKGVEKCEEMIKAGQITEAREYLKGYQLSDKANTHLKQVFADHAPKPTEAAENKPANEAKPEKKVTPPAAKETQAEAPKPTPEAKPAAAPADQKPALPESAEFPNEEPEVEHNLPDAKAHELFKMIDEGKLQEVRAELNKYKLKPEARAAYKQRLAAAEAKQNQLTPPAANQPAEATADTSGPATADQKERAIKLTQNQAIPRRYKTDLLLKINKMTAAALETEIENMQDIIELANAPAE